jgi:hypothetical protein
MEKKTRRGWFAGILGVLAAPVGVALAGRQARGDTSGLLSRDIARLAGVFGSGAEHAKEFGAALERSGLVKLVELECEYRLEKGGALLTGGALVREEELPLFPAGTYRRTGREAWGEARQYPTFAERLASVKWRDVLDVSGRHGLG